MTNALTTLAAQEKTGTPDEFREFIIAEFARWSKVMRAAERSLLGETALTSGAMCRTS